MRFLSVFTAAVLSLVLCPVCPVRAQDAKPAISRGPYLQMATTTGVTVVWRTRSGGAPSVRFGVTSGNLTETAGGDAVKTRRSRIEGGAAEGGEALSFAPSETRQHEAVITGLKPDTEYFYAVYEGEARLTPAGRDFRFRTLPAPGAPRDLLFWVVGDSGTGNRVQVQVHQAMREKLLKERRTLDFYLHVGDMAYGSGLDSEFQGYFFDCYAETLRQTVCWPAMGNHEGRNSNGKTGAGPYYDAYVCPANGESGGVPSGSESYYSFDYGKAHFICLNSHDLPRDPDGAMARWLKADLERTRAEWLVAFWHHPPYTKGSHDSDKAEQLVEMRRNIMPILESGGVDLVLTGHSHIYERSMLMDGAYATPTVAENVVLDDGDGNPAGDGAYHKGAGLNPNEGTVQIVAGNGGTTLSRKDKPSPVMRATILEFGSVLVDIKGKTLTATMLNHLGKERDTFQIVKEGAVTVTRVARPWTPPLLTGPTRVPLRGGPDKGLEAAPPEETKPPATFVTLIPQGAEWQYLAGGAEPDPGWKRAEFDAKGWKTGPAGFGYDDKDDATELADMRGKYQFLCIRKTFTLPPGADPEKLGLSISYDDAFIVYINDREALRMNVETGSQHTARGISPHEAKRKFEYFSLKPWAGLLRKGVNVIAIEGYNDDLGSSDLTLHPQLILDTSLK